MLWLVILWGLLGLVVAVLCVLALPVRLRVFARSEPRRQLRLELGLLGGLVPAFAMFDSTRPRKVAREPEVPERPRPKKKRKTGGGSGRRRARGIRLVRAAPALLRGALGCLRVDRFHVECAFGFDDPAATGQAYGMLAPLVFGTQWLWGNAARVGLTPVFDRPCLEGEADIAVAITPIRLLPPALRFGWAAFGPVR